MLVYRLIKGEKSRGSDVKTEKYMHQSLITIWSYTDVNTPQHGYIFHSTLPNMFPDTYVALYFHPFHLAQPLPFNNCIWNLLYIKAHLQSD